MAALLVLSLIPMTAVAVSEATLPQETFGRTTYETIVLYDTGAPISGNGQWATYGPASGVGKNIAASGKKAVDADGILIDLKWTGATSIVQLKFKLDSNPSVNGGGGATDGFYYGKGNHISGSSSTGNWLLINSKDWEGTVFIPKEKLDNWDKAAFDILSIALSAGTYDNVRLAYKVSEVPLVSGAPKTLPTTKDEYQISYLSKDFSWSANGKTSYSNWFGDVFGLAGDTFLTADGILFKFDTSKVPTDNKEILGLGIQLAVGSGKQYQSGDAAGTPTGSTSSYYLLSSGMLRYHNGGVYTYNGTLVGQLDEGVCSTTWYYSIDGQTWNSATEDATKSRCVYLTDAHTQGYIFLPFEELWCAGPNGRVFGGYMQVVPFADAIDEIVAGGKNLKISNFGLCTQSSNGGKSQNLAILPETVFSEFSVTTCKHNWVDGKITADPTHLESGVQEISCDKCLVASTKELPKLEGHIWGDSWEEDDQINHKQTCPCKEERVEPHQWDEGEVTRAATVDTEGIKTYTCTTKGCYATKNESIAKLSASTDDGAEDSGCGSVVSGGFAVMANLSGAAVMLTRKKRR